MVKTVLVCLLVAIGSIGYAQLEITLSDGFNLADLAKYKRALAMDIAQLLKDENSVLLLSEKLSSRNPSCDLLAFLKENSTNSRERDLWMAAVAQLDKNIREAKGIADRVETILNIRLAFPERGLNSNDFLVAYRPAGNEKTWESIEAFDTTGNSYKLSVTEIPQKQVIVVGLDSKKDMKAGVALMNEELQKAGMQPVSRTTARAGLEVAKLDYIRLEDDQEPWLLGDAEIYVLVNGISPESSKAAVISVDMPYLDTDKKDYYPNQVVIVWDNYRYKAANLNVFEHDDNTNYKEIVAMLVEKIGDVAPDYKMIAEIASKIIRLMPDSIFTNDDDYVDVFYTLERKAYTNYYGVSRNAKITLVPYVIPE